MVNIKRALLVMGIVCAVSMLAINESGVPVTLIQIASKFHLPMSDEHWIINAYLLSLACFLLPAGRMVHCIGPRKSNVIGYSIFIIASWLISQTASLPMLLLYRAMQGLAAAALINSNICLVNRYLAKPKIISIIVTISAACLVTAPMLAGILTEYFTWRHLFWLNIPLGLIALMLTYPYNHHNQGKPKLMRFRNLLTINIGLFCLICTIMQIPKWGFFDIRTLALLAFAIASLILLIHSERRIPATFMDLLIFRHKPIVLANTILFAAGFTTIAEIYWILWLERCMQFSPLETGLAILPALIPTLLIIPFSQKMTNLFGRALPVIIGNVMAFLGTSLMMRMALLHAYEALFPAMLIYGFAPPLIFSPTIAMATKTAHTEQQPLLSALAYASWQFGAALGIAMIGLVLLSYANTHAQHAYNLINYSHGFIWSLLLPVVTSALGLIASLMYWQLCPTQLGWLRES